MAEKISAKLKKPVLSLQATRYDMTVCEINGLFHVEISVDPLKTVIIKYENTLSFLADWTDIKTVGIT